jgi:choline dehydrogenase-like flavoprotein
MRPSNGKRPRANSRAPTKETRVIYEPCDIRGDVSKSADVCVIGSGAGGAVVAKELAEAGRSVVVLEEGAHFTRRDYGRPLEMFNQMYRCMSQVFMLGVPPFLLSLGKTIGGTTTVNSHTIFRIPEHVLAKWRGKYGLDHLTPESLEPVYRKVEEYLNVHEAEMELIGNNGRLFLEGARKLGYSAGLLKKNTRGCKGLGICQYGCPIDAKQSMNVTYVPDAVNAGASVYSQARADEIYTDSGRARGVAGVIEGKGGARYRIEVDADAVVVAAGAVHTPSLLMKNKLANSSGKVGKNLVVHPVSRLWALYDEQVDMMKGISQGVYVDEFEGDGYFMEGISYPPEIVSIAAPPFVGREHKEFMSNYRQLGSFGVICWDDASGRVVNNPLSREPMIFYQTSKKDVRKLAEGNRRAAEIFFAAGARKVWTNIQGYTEFNSPRELLDFDAGKVRGTHYDVLMAFHPQGTCPMGVDPGESVVSPTGECHDVAGLYIADASVFPTSVERNPQLAINVMATLIAGNIEEALEERCGAAAAGASA